MHSNLYFVLQIQKRRQNLNCLFWHNFNKFSEEVLDHKNVSELLMPVSKKCPKRILKVSGYYPDTLVRWAIRTSLTWNFPAMSNNTCWLGFGDWPSSPALNQLKINSYTLFSIKLNSSSNVFSLWLFNFSGRKLKVLLTWLAFTIVDEIYS